jgi:GTPase-associated protein 1, N-terminal domain type 2
VPIEQAVFTSARTTHGDGYQLVARSPGVSDDNARELAVWGPSHGALFTERDEATSINFCTLASGVCCVSKTVAAGQEYSGRGGARVYTHFLLVPTDVMTRFANNPFAVLRAAWAKGMLGVHDRWPDDLESFSLVGRSAAVDEGLLAQIAEQWGAARIALLVQSAMQSGVHLLAGVGNSETLIGGLLQCFPPDCRTEISFTTGLRYSPRRPFRLAPLDSDAAEQRRAARQEGVSVVDLTAAAEAESSLHPWAEYVAECIASDRLSSFVSQLQRPGVTLAQLDAVGEQLLRQRSLTLAHAASDSGSPKRGQEPLNKVPDPFSPSDTFSSSRAESNGAARPPKPRVPRLAVTTGTPPDIHTISDPAAIEQLEQLDDAVYDAINGSVDAMATVNELWQQLCSQLSPATLAAAREQYLRYTLTLWDACADEPLREPQRAARALDVLTVLFEPE